MTTPWTRLEGGDLWVTASAMYETAGLDYHNLHHHVRGMYADAAALGVPYDPRLDACILAHDVVMHLGPGANERASMEWLAKASGKGEAWASPILGTIEHRPSEDETGLSMLDLAGFTCGVRAAQNSRLLRAEAARSAEKRGETFDEAAWVARNRRYLDGLHDRIMADLPGVRSIMRQAVWEGIDEGVCLTARHLPAILGSEEPDMDAETLARVIEGGAAWNDVFSAQCLGLVVYGPDGCRPSGRGEAMLTAPCEP